MPHGTVTAVAGGRGHVGALARLTSPCYCTLASTRQRINPNSPHPHSSCTSPQPPQRCPPRLIIAAASFLEREAAWVRRFAKRSAGWSLEIIMSATALLLNSIEEPGSIGGIASPSLARALASLLNRRCPPHPSPSLSSPRDVLPTLSFFHLIVMKATQSRSRTGSPSSERSVVSHLL